MILVQALITALLSGLFSGAIMFALNERRERNALYLAKIEQMIEIYINWCESVANWPVMHYDLFRVDHEDRDKARDSVSDYWKNKYLDFQKARIIQQIYLPQENAPFSDVMLVCSELIKLSAELKNKSLEGNPMPDDMNEKIKSLGSALVDASLKGRLRLFEAARQFAHAPHLIRLPKRKLKA